MAIRLSNMQCYAGGTSGVSAVIGYESRRSRVVRFEFTTESNGADKISISTSTGVIGHADGAEITSIPFYITTNGTSYANAVASNGYAAHGYIKKNGNIFSGSANVLLKDNTKYYVWFFPSSATYGWAYWNTGSNYYIECTLSGRSKYTLTTSISSNVSVSVSRLSSELAGTGTLESGSTIYKNDKLKIVFTANNNYSVQDSSVNGLPFVSGNTHTVTGDVSIVASASQQLFTIAATDAVVGSTSVITVSGGNSSYTHIISYSIPDANNHSLMHTGVVSPKTSTQIIAWRVPEDLYEYMPNSKKTSCILRCSTYNGENLLGTTLCTINITVDDDACCPLVSGNVIDTNQTTIALTGNEKTLIRYKSTAKCTIDATPCNYATIVSKTILKQPAVNDTYTFYGVAADMFEFSVTDSRGYHQTYVYTPEIIPYIKLTCNPIISRPSPTGSRIVLSVTGDMFIGTFGAASNSLKIRYRYKESNGTYGSWYTVPSTSVYYGTSSYYCTDISLGENFDYQKSYVFEIEASDGTATNPLSIISKIIPIQKGEPVFDWGENDFNINVALNLSGTNILDIIYPPGVVYTHSSSTLPDSISGIGTWSSVSTGITGVYAWKRTG